MSIFAKDKLNTSKVFWVYCLVPGLILLLVFGFFFESMWAAVGHITLVAVVYYVIVLPWVLVSSIAMWIAWKVGDATIVNRIYVALFIVSLMFFVVLGLYIYLAAMAIP